MGQVCLACHSLSTLMPSKFKFLEEEFGLLLPINFVWCGSKVPNLRHTLLGCH